MVALFLQEKVHRNCRAKEVLLELHSLGGQ